MGSVLDAGLNERQEPAGTQVQHEDQSGEERLASMWNEGGKHNTVVGEQGTVGAHEENLADPKLWSVLVSNCRLLANAETAPEDAEYVHTEEDKQP